MSGFDERERAEEARYRHELEFGFRVRNRRNRLLGEWVAQQLLGLEGEAVAEYARSVVMAEFEAPRGGALRKVEVDLGTAARAVGATELAERYEAFEVEAREQVQAE